MGGNVQEESTVVTKTVQSQSNSYTQMVPTVLFIDSDLLTGLFTMFLVLNTVDRFNFAKINFTN